MARYNVFMSDTNITTWSISWKTISINKNNNVSFEQWLTFQKKPASDSPTTILTSYIINIK